MKLQRIIFITVALAVLAAAGLRPAPALADANAGVDAASGGPTVLEGPIAGFVFTDQLGRRFDFTPASMQGKAVVVNFIYTDCGHACPLIVRHLADAFKKAGRDFGGRFTALTIGLDTERDTPEHMADFGRKFAKDPAKWVFASADAKTVAGLAKALGVYYKRTEDGFEHANVVTVIGPDRAVFARVIGPAPTPDEILRPVYASLETTGMVEVAPGAGGASSLLDRLRLLCYSYDPATGEYRADYGFLVVIGLGFSVLGAGVFFIRHLIRGARQAVGNAGAQAQD
ncbi:MAG: SCO family protein [Deltaproteobacteria bacterium]|nr:SCO family protein [Deltaproteobacteria bacterium]